MVPHSGWWHLIVEAKEEEKGKLQQIFSIHSNYKGRIIVGQRYYLWFACGIWTCLSADGIAVSFVKNVFIFIGITLLYEYYYLYYEFWGGCHHASSWPQLKSNEPMNQKSVHRDNHFSSHHHHHHNHTHQTKPCYPVSPSSVPTPSDPSSHDPSPPNRVNRKSFWWDAGHPIVEWGGIMLCRCWRDGEREIRDYCFFEREARTVVWWLNIIEFCFRLFVKGLDGWACN